MRYWIIIALLIPFSACNTVRGVGEDLQEGGLAIEEAAEAAQYEEPRPAPPRRQVY